MIILSCYLHISRLDRQGNIYASTSKAESGALAAHYVGGLSSDKCSFLIYRAWCEYTLALSVASHVAPA